MKTLLTILLCFTISIATAQSKIKLKTPREGYMGPSFILGGAGVTTISLLSPIPTTAIGTAPYYHNVPFWKQGARTTGVCVGVTIVCVGVFTTLFSKQ